MRFSFLILIPVFLTGCDAKHYDDDDYVVRDSFAHLSCTGASEPSLVASKIRQLKAEQSLIVEETETIVGLEGAVVLVSFADDLQSGGTQITLFFEDRTADVIVFANKATEPDSEDRELLDSILEASALIECRAISPE